jgi:hypothetical protein
MSSSELEPTPVVFVFANDVISALPVRAVAVTVLIEVVYKIEATPPPTP